MTKLKRFYPLVTMLIFPVLGMLYALVNRPSDKVYQLMTSFDHSIPFIKYFAVPYSIWIVFIYICLVYFFIKDPKVYFQSLITYTVCALVCYFVYMVFQTTVPRPSLSGNDPFTRLVSYIYLRDQPYNCFPSIHCFSSYLMIKALFTSKFRNKWNQIIIYSISVLIILSTLFVKQHAIADVLAAIALVEVVHRVVVHLGRSEKSVLNKTYARYSVTK